MSEPEENGIKIKYKTEIRNLELEYELGLRPYELPITK
jgi:hypothetical protein